MKKSAVMALVGLLVVGGGLTSCKPKKSAYRSMYEKAKQREVAQQDLYPAQEEEQTPIVVAEESDVREEKLSIPQGESAPNGISAYSVCVGSFKNITNARSLRERMVADGYADAILAQNDLGMYRVLVSGHETKEAAVSARDEIIRKYAPAFSDAWIVRRAY